MLNKVTVNTLYYNMDVLTVTCWLDGIPIVGHIKALMYHIQDNNKLSCNAFYHATRNTGVALFGVFGGYLAGSVLGSFVGGIIGGLTVDAKISELTLNDYGYIYYKDKSWNRDMLACDWLDLLCWTVKDASTPLLALSAYGIYNTLLVNMENQMEVDCYSLLEKAKKVFEIHVNSHMNYGPLQQSLEDSIPILGHLRSLLFYVRNERNLAANAFKGATHQTLVICCGVLGGYMTESIAGSIIGGILGGLFVDGHITQLTAKNYGYFDLPMAIDNEDWEADNYFHLIFLMVKDGITGISALHAYIFSKIATRPLNEVENQYALYYIRRIDGTQAGYETEINCYSLTCEKPKISKGDGFRDNRHIKDSCTQELPEVTKLPVDSILQLKPGDHIVYARFAFWKLKLYDHHAIVGEVFQDKGIYTVYEQSSSSYMYDFNFFGKATIKKHKKTFDTEPFHKIDHGEKALPRDEVCQTAHYICHHAAPVFFNTRYNVITNNCEHFAYFCATGLRRSLQVQESSTAFKRYCMVQSRFVMMNLMTMSMPILQWCIIKAESCIEGFVSFIQHVLSSIVHKF